MTLPLPPELTGISFRSAPAGERSRSSRATEPRPGDGGLAASFRARIRRAVREFDRNQTPETRPLGSSRRKRIGLIFPELLNSYLLHFFDQFENAAILQGYEVLVGTANSTSSGMDNLARNMIERGVKGVAVLANSVEPNLVDLFLQEGLRLILLTSTHCDSQPEAIGLDINDSADQTVQHLAVLGHRDIAFAHDRSDNCPLSISLDAFLIAMNRIGSKVEQSRILLDSGEADDGFGMLHKLLKQPAVPTAVVCSSDVIALRLLKAIDAKGFRAPAEISVTGFGDLSLARCANPPLTTIQVSQPALAAALSGFLRSIDGENLRPIGYERKIGVRLLVRLSTSFPRNSRLPGGALG